MNPRNPNAAPKILIAGLNQLQKDRIATWLHDKGYIGLMAHDLTEAQNILDTVQVRIAIIGLTARQLVFGRTAIIMVSPRLSEEFLLGEILAELDQHQQMSTEDV